MVAPGGYARGHAGNSRHAAKTAVDNNNDGVLAVPAGALPAAIRGRYRVVALAGWG